ncbi:Cystine transporter [Lachancea thermotolerans]
MNLESALGYGYVIPWSVSIYPVVWHNWRHRSASAMSIDFVIINVFGYLYLLLSLWLQLFCWQTGQEHEDSTRPKITAFDFYYCLHGVVMNMVVVSQVLWGNRVWNFKSGGSPRMKPVYRKLLIGSMIVASLSAGQFLTHNFQMGWNNDNTLAFSNTLYALKISMSLIKYLPQVKHNYERKTLRGFPIQSVVCDVMGSLCSLGQLVVQVARDRTPLTTAVLSANFGRIGIAAVTLFFNFIYISQWLVYGQ